MMKSPTLAHESTPLLRTNVEKQELTMSKNMLGFSKDFRGTLNDLLEKLGGENGEEWLAAFKRFLRKENPWEVVKQEFKTWKTIKLGTHKSAGLLRETLEAAKFRISDWAADILQKTALSETVVEIELVRVTVGELGFANGATRKEIYDRALESGLALCPAEVGPQLRLQYADQPHAEYFVIAMDPADSDGVLIVFYVDRDAYGQWLRTDRGNPGDRWGAGSMWVFARRK